MTHAEQLRARLAEAERRIALQVAQVANLRAPGAAGLEQAAEGLRRLTDIRDAYARILEGPCPLSQPARRLNSLSLEGEGGARAEGVGG